MADDDYDRGYADGLKAESESCDFAWSIIFFVAAVRAAGWLSERAIATDHVMLHTATIAAFTVTGLLSIYCCCMFVRFAFSSKG